MTEIVVCSGKGGTGKTSVTAALASLADNVVLADCDVDAADLHLVLAPEHTRTEKFVGGKQAFIQPDLCLGCGQCADLCRFQAITPVAAPDGELAFRVGALHCEGCGVCVHFCPAEAIDFVPSVNGTWHVSSTRRGPMVHACLQPGQENSGKLVTLVRQQARRLAERIGSDLILVDGPPGIGCPVTAALTGADLLLAVTEPGVSGRHDLHRLLQLAWHFDVPAGVIINKVDINSEVASVIEDDCRAAGVPVLGCVPFDPAVTRAQLQACSVIELGHGPAASSLLAIWQSTGHFLQTT